MVSPTGGGGDDLEFILQPSKHVSSLVFRFGGFCSRA